MTAEGTACNGAGEAPKAEFAPEKVVVAASPEEKAAGEREGEDVGGPFVIVNGGDSDGHSDRGSDLGKAPDEDSPSEEDDAPGSNAAPDAAVGGDHGAAEVEAGAAGAALGASSADGVDRASDGSESGADEGKGEPSSDCVAEVAHQEAVGEEEGAAAALASGGGEPAIAGADSEAPAVDSEVEGKEGTVDGSAVADVAEAVVQQEASTEQDGDAAVMSSSHDDALTSPKFCSSAMESEVIREDSKEQSTTDVVEPQEVITTDVVEPQEVIREVSKEQSTTDAVEAQEVIREDSKEQSTTDVVEPQEQGTVGASAFVENEHRSADMRADSFVAATEPDSQEDAVVESETDSQEDAVVESCRHDDALCIESGSADIESEVYGENSKQELSKADVVEAVGQGVGRADALMANGHLCADTQADSSEATTEPENHANESKLTEVAESVEDAAANATDASSLTNGHIYVALGVDSCRVASESKAHSFETDGQETDQQEEEAPKTEAEVSEGVLKPTERNCAASVDELTGEEVDADGHASVQGTADASGEQGAKPMQVEGEATCGILEFEEVDKYGEEGLCDESTVGVVSSNEETEFPIKERTDQVISGVNVVELEEVTENTSQDTMQGGLAIGTIHVKLGSDPYVESSLEHKVKAEVDLVNEITAESDLKAENTVEVKRTVHEVDEIEVKQLAFADGANLAPSHLQQDCGSVMETTEHEKVEAPGDCQAHEIENSSEVEPKKEFEMEVDDAVPLHEAGASAASVFHHEPRSIDLVENDSCNHSSPTTVLESCDHVQTEESRSQEISTTTVEQPICGASLEHGTVVADEAEINSATGNGSKEKCSDIAVDELVVVDDQPSFDPSCESARLDKPGCISKNDDSSEIVEDSNSLVNQSEICNGECSSRIANDGSPNEAPHLTEEPCLSDKPCNNIEYENGNEPATSSDVVETKCVEAIVTEQKDNGHHASGEWHGDHAQVIVPQKVYIIKVPKFAGDDLWNKIQAAQAHLDQLTQERDAINRRRQKQKVVCDQYREKLEAARREEREARAAHGDKKNDLNSVRSVLGKLQQANSVEELDELIVKKEKTLQHETMSLKEEKSLIKEINELKAQRKQLSATMGSKAEINEAFDQKDHIHERHKVLKKDSDVLFTNLKALEENTRKIQKSFEDERTALRKLTEEHRAANEIRQKAYIEWTELRSEPGKKNEYFFKYRDARNAAETFRANGDTHGLMSHCNSQIERVMEMWNQNEDFRKQYVESNKVSTLKRLGTHDGRRLGPDEDPPVIPSRRPSSIYPLSASSPEVPTLASIPAPVLAAPAAVPAKEDSFPVLAGPQTSKRAKSKASGSSAQIENNSVTVSEPEDLKQTLKEKARLLEEQLELARKAEELARKEEELRKERDAAEKERLRMEQKAKAKEAEERKRRKAEKDKERAEFKARKEAEEREKKKAKKDKKKGTTPADSSAIGDSHAAAALATTDTDSNASDNPREVEVSQPAAPKRLSRPAAAIKQLNRLQPMPAPLRNKGRRKLRQYILIAAAVLSVLALFVAGNYIPRLKSVHS